LSDAEKAQLVRFRPSLGSKL